MQNRYKPLGMVLKGMMQRIVDCKKHLIVRKRFYRKRMHFRVTLMRRTKHFGDLPIIAVTHETVFKGL